LATPYKDLLLIWFNPVEEVRLGFENSANRSGLFLDFVLLALVLDNDFK